MAMPLLNPSLAGISTDIAGIGMETTLQTYSIYYSI